MKLREILTLNQSPLSIPIHEAIGLLDSLHTFPTSLAFPIVTTKRRYEQGSYHYLSHPSRPLRIEISRFATCPAWTLIHEAGHFLDHMALNPTKRAFASEHDPLFDDLTFFWQRSAAVHEMERLLKRRRATSREKLYLRNYLRPPELWARSYVQWAAIRSGDEVLRDHLEYERHAAYLEYPLPVQWDDSEFLVIMNAVENLLTRARLI